VLKIERRLMAISEGKRRNMLLIQGMGGSGKTTLLRHLMEWWQTTGFVEQVSYFGYDERTWNAGQIMDRLAQELLGDKLGIFRALDAAAQRKMLGHKMCSEKHLLVLDNMESITGSSLAIKNTLKPEELQELRTFLAELLGGETMVLMSSRGSEEWLADGEGAPLRPSDVYHLPGLDDQAATTLAERVLERHVNDVKKRETYRQSEEFQKLLKLLDGYPLPIQVVLANLADQTPGQVLGALKEGGAIKDDSKIQDKTESIMLCIEYSHGNLKPEDQKLLMTLAPFTGVVFQPLIEKYIEYMRQQPALKDLPFQRMPEVLQRAQDWGLVTTDRMTGYLRLQPVLPYFLRTRLNQEPEEKQAVEAAYRAIYDGVTDMLASLMDSKDAQEKQRGQALAGQEYENLYTALEMDLKAKGSILQPYRALSLYLESTQEQQRGLEMGQMVRAELEGYSAEALQGPIGLEVVYIVDNIAMRQLSLKRYVEAGEGYKKALELYEGLTTLDTKTKALGKTSIYHNLGVVAQKQRLWLQAEEYYQKALKICIDFNDRYRQARTYHQLGYVAQEQRLWPQAEEYYQKALEIYTEFNDRYSQASTYHNLGMVTEEQRLWPQAEEYYQKALKICIEFNDRYNQASTYHQLGYVAQEQRLWPQAEEYYQTALEIYIKFNDRYNQASTYHNLGMVAQEQRLWLQAEEYYQKGLEICIKSKDRYEQVSTYHKLGYVAQEQRKWPQAEEYYQKGLEIFIELDDRHNQAGTYRNLGMVAQEQRKWQQAEEYYQKALEIYIEFNDWFSQAGTYNQLSAVAREQRLWQQAEEYYQKALEIYIEFKDRYSQAGTYHNLGMVAQEQRLWQQAEEYYQKALKIFEFKDRYSQARTYHRLGMVAQEQRKWDIARENLLKALEILFEFEDQHSGAIALRSLSCLWQATTDHRILTEVARILSISQEDAKKLLERVAK